MSAMLENSFYTREHILYAALTSENFWQAFYDKWWTAFSAGISF